MDEVIKISDNQFLDMKLVSAITSNTKLTYQEISNVLCYNVITPKHLNILTKRSISAIQNLMRPRKLHNGEYITELTQVFPLQLGNYRGPAFILFDQKCYDYILKTYEPKSNGGTDKLNSESEGGEPDNS